MKSLEKEMDGYMIAAEVRMERQTHKGTFLLVEGSTDMKRFERSVAEGRCSFVNCFGKRNAKEAIELLYDEGFAGVLGMIDADFDRLLGAANDHEGLVVSANHDFDLDAAITTVFERYLNEVGDTEKIGACGGPRELLRTLLAAIKPLTALRFANERHKLGYALKSLRIEDFFDGTNIDIGAMIDAVSWGKFDNSSARARLKRLVEQYVEQDLDLYQATCGHDFCAALGIALRQLAGDRKSPQTWQSEIEMHFRLAFDLGHFSETQAFSAISKWEIENPPYLVLKRA